MTAFALDWVIEVGQRVHMGHMGGIAGERASIVQQMNVHRIAGQHCDRDDQQPADDFATSCSVGIPAFHGRPRGTS